MDNVSTLKVRDKDEDQEALAIVRPVNGFVALALSLEHGADVEIAFTPSECEDLIGRLQAALAEARSESLVSTGRTFDGSRSSELVLSR